MPIGLSIDLPNNNNSMNIITNIIGDLGYYEKYYTNAKFIKIGSGSYGVIYLSTATDGSVAVVKKIFLETPAIKEEAINEAKVLHNLTGINISPDFYAFAIEYNYSILIMEWVKGKTLTNVFEEVMDNASREKLLNSIDNVLDILHENGFVHYDIKPDNILIENDTNRILLIDFGSSQRIGNKYKNVAQTPHYSKSRSRSPTEFINSNNSSMNNYSQDTLVTPNANSYSMNIIRKNSLQSGHKSRKNRK